MVRIENFETFGCGNFCAIFFFEFPPRIFRRMVRIAEIQYFQLFRNPSLEVSVPFYTVKVVPQFLVEWSASQLYSSSFSRAGFTGNRFTAFLCFNLADLSIECDTVPNPQ